MSAIPFDRSITSFIETVSQLFPCDFPSVLIREIAQYFVLTGMSRVAGEAERSLCHGFS